GISDSGQGCGALAQEHSRRTRVVLQASKAQASVKRQVSRQGLRVPLRTWWSPCTWLFHPPQEGCAVRPINAVRFARSHWSNLGPCTRLGNGEPLGCLNRYWTPRRVLPEILGMETGGFTYPPSTAPVRAYQRLR